VLAFNPIQPITDAMVVLVDGVHRLVPSYGLDMILIALIVRVALWPLANQQFKSMAEMQKLQPLMKELQAKHKGNPQELQAATMALYKEHGVNPLAGCLPMLIQLPLLIGLYWAINNKSEIHDFSTQGFLWIGSSLSQQYPHILGTSMATFDIPLFLIYVASMYISVRYGSPPSTDPQQAQTQKIMAFVSPAMIAWFGWKYQFASALLLYWFSLNVFTMIQQGFMYRRFGLLGGRAKTPALAVAEPVRQNGKSGSARQTPPAAKNGSTSGRSSKRSKS
jgi:YidC/Oxa1 family membrane protein insertase